METTLMATTTTLMPTTTLMEMPMPTGMGMVGSAGRRQTGQLARFGDGRNGSGSGRQQRLQVQVQE